MKNLLTLFAVLGALFVTGAASAQTVKAGVGVGSLKLGMSQADVIAQLAEPESARDIEEERGYFSSAGYVVSQELMFVLGFDSVLQFDNADESEMPLPVYKTYFGDDALNYIILTSYGYSPSLAGQLKIKGIRMFSPAAKVQKKFGDPDLRVAMDDLEYELYYLDQGLMFSVSEEEVRALHLFPTLDTTKQEEFLALHQ
jgi:hypothetical protein